MSRKIDLTGQRLGKLLVVEEAGRSKHGHALWKCLCDCGNEKIIQSDHLRSGHTQSCGCLQKKRASEANLGKNHPMFGKTRPEETRKKISDAIIGKYCGENNHMYGKTGKNHPRYNPNLTDTERLATRNYLEYNEWRAEIYKRDDYTCQVCGDNKGGNLIAHHLESYANNKELRTSVDNGITFCKDCHKDFHHQYGNNNTRKQFEEFSGGIKNEIYQI